MSELYTLLGLQSFGPKYFAFVSLYSNNVFYRYMEGLLYFIICTLTFYLMYYFYKPKPIKSDKDNQYSSAPPIKADHIKDTFTSLESVSQALLAAGVSKASLLLGIDLTASNEWQGRLTFSRNNLHKLHPVRNSIVYNPYQRVINIIGKTLHPFTETGNIFAYGFGDIITQDMSVVNITGEEGSPCKDFREVLDRYNEMVREVQLSGPTSFAPIIRRSMKHS